MVVTPRRRRARFLSLSAAALLLSFVPWIHLPFEWFETLLHETSHALVAWLTGGQVARIDLHLTGAGETWSAGGWRFGVSLAGYVGAVFGGLGLYRLAAAAGTRFIRPLIGLLVVLGVVETAGWLALNLNTWFVMATLLGLLGLLLWSPAQRWSQGMLEFIGLYVMVSAVRSPLYLVVGHPLTSDAMTLQQITWVPAIAWALAWMALSLVAWLRLYRREMCATP